MLSKKEYILHPDGLHKTKYNAYKNCLRKCLLEAEKNYYNELFENNKDSVFNLWKTLNPIINPRKTTTRTVINKLMYTGKRITNKQEISDTMNTHFCDIGVRLQSQLPDYGNRFLEYLPSRSSDSFYLAPTCKEDVLCEIKKMKPMKAPGHDSIGTKIIHLCPDIFAENLSKIFNNAILQGVYPDAMKIAKVIALFKGGIKSNPITIGRLVYFLILIKYSKKFYAKDLLHSWNKNKYYTATNTDFENCIPQQWR